jgi:hypothetical protein
VKRQMQLTKNGAFAALLSKTKAVRLSLSII